MTPKVSVIIPFYNVEKYIGRCLQSVVGQSFDDIEIICVDDCSPDDSLRIVQKYASFDKRIKIVSNPRNLRLGKAREAGFFAANGEYVTFVDSDDTISFDYVERLYNKAKETDAEVVKANAKIIFKNGYSMIKEESELINQNFTNGKSLLLSNWFDLWGFLIRKDLIVDNKIMPDTINGDDCCIVRIFYYVKKFAIVDEAFYYYYYENENSFSGTMNYASFKIRYDCVSSQIQLINSFENVDKDTYIAFVKIHLKNAYDMVKTICQYTNKEWETLIANEFIRVINDEIKLTSDEKQKYILDLIDKDILMAINTCDTATLIKLAQRQAKSAGKFARLWARIVSSFVPFKEARIKFRNKVLCSFSFENLLFTDKS